MTQKPYKPLKGRSGADIMERLLKLCADWWTWHSWTRGNKKAMHDTWRQKFLVKQEIIRLVQMSTSGVCGWTYHHDWGWKSEVKMRKHRESKGNVSLKLTSSRWLNDRVIFINCLKAEQFLKEGYDYYVSVPSNPSWHHQTVTACRDDRKCVDGLSRPFSFLEAFSFKALDMRRRLSLAYRLVHGWKQKWKLELEL